MATILIIDDSEYGNRLAEHFRPEYEVHICNNIITAITYFEKDASNLKLVVLNILIGDRNHLDVLKKLKEINITPEILVYSPKEQDVELAVEAMKEGAIDFLDNPSFYDLIVKSERVLEAIQFTQKKATLPSSSLLSSDQRLNKLIHRRRIEGRALDHDEMLQALARINPSGNKDELTLEKIHHQLQKILRKTRPAAEKPTILIVEDEVQICQVLKEMLENNYEVVIANNGKEALELAEKTPVVDIMLLDIFLPDIKGTQLLPQLKHYKPAAQVIIITAYRIVGVAVETLSSGASDYLNKPFTKAELEKKLQDALERKWYEELLEELKEGIESGAIDLKDRMELLREMAASRKKTGRKIHLKDVQRLFPELRGNDLDETLVISPEMLSETPDHFIQHILNLVGKKR